MPSTSTHRLFIVNDENRSEIEGSDPVVGAIIETRYDRTTDPSQQAPATGSQDSAPVPPITTADTSAAPPTPLVSLLQPTPQAPHGLTNKTDNVTDAVQQGTSRPKLSTNRIPPAPDPGQTVSTPTKTATPVNDASAQVNDASAKAASPPNNDPDTSPKRSKPSRSSATDATHGVEGVTSNPTKHTSTGDGSSQTSSGSDASMSHK